MKMIDSLTHYFRNRRQLREKEALTELKARYHAFRIFLENNGRALELIVMIDNKLNHGDEADIRSDTEELLSVTGELVDGLNLLSGDGHAALYSFYGKMAEQVSRGVDGLQTQPTGELIFCSRLSELDPGTFHQFGLKASKLARLRQMALPVPEGFVCTTEACKLFLSRSGLTEKIRELLRKFTYQQDDAAAVAASIREMILQSPLPLQIRQALEHAYDRLAESVDPTDGSNQPPAVSVRSSGVSEDGVEHSFAGQFASILNVRGVDELIVAFKEVVASGFSARAIMYRLNAGMASTDFDLAVLCQVMVDARCAGVLFSCDPSAPESGRMLISAVPGLGTTAVGGSAPVDLYRPPRTEPSAEITGGENQCGTRINWDISSRELMEGAQIARKTIREVASEQRGLQLEPVPEEEADLPLLSIETLAELVRLGEIIESLEGNPQDVEWAQAKSGSVVILQARPLRLPPSSKGRRTRLPQAAAPLVSGTCASAGKVVGRIKIVRSAEELHQFIESAADMFRQAPCILTMPSSIVDAAGILKQCTGAIIDTGNPTDHLSCIAREYDVPMITGTRNGLSCLEEGQWVILDADHGIALDAPESIWSAVARNHEQQCQESNRRESTLQESSRTEKSDDLSPQRRTLRRMIVPLNLTDAYGATFSRQECRSIHDLIRYTHEMAVLAMFDAGDLVMEEAGRLLHPLDIGVPFSFLVIDVGGGLRRKRKTRFRDQLVPRHQLGREDVLSIPLAALCDGLTTPGLSWATGPDAEALPGIFSRTMLDNRSARPAGSFNYALAARDYLNLNARVEFHFAMLDAVCGRDSHANYIRFRFKGGGAGLERSHRRAVFLRHVLESNGFFTSVVGDLVTASLTGATKDMVQQRLVMLGKLLGFSRFLDGAMTSEDTPYLLAQAFLAGRLDAGSALEVKRGTPVDEEEAQQ